MSIRNPMMAFGLAGALALGAAVSVSAGPFPVGTAVKDGASGSLTNVRWRGYGFGPGIAFGLAAGALAGAAIAARPYYYGPGYYYGGYYGLPVYDATVYGSGSVYGSGYYVAPGYYGGYYRGYGYGWGQCYTNEGYGRYRPCDAF
jgi:hypothetical protein